jgi:hypothetical protein
MLQCTGDIRIVADPGLKTTFRLGSISEVINRLPGVNVSAVNWLSLFWASLPLLAVHPQNYTRPPCAAMYIPYIWTFLHLVSGNANRRPGASLSRQGDRILALSI